MLPSKLKGPRGELKELGGKLPSEQKELRGELKELREKLPRELKELRKGLPGRLHEQLKEEEDLGRLLGTYWAR